MFIKNIDKGIASVEEHIGTMRQKMDAQLQSLVGPANAQERIDVQRTFAAQQKTLLKQIESMNKDREETEAEIKKIGHTEEKKGDKGKVRKYVPGQGFVEQ